MSIYDCLIFESLMISFSIAYIALLHIYLFDREVFARYGPIYEVSIIRDRVTKGHKGTVFVKCKACYSTWCGFYRVLFFDILFS